MNFFRSKLSKKKHSDTNTPSSSAATGAYASSMSNSENQSGCGLSIEYFQIQFLLDCLMRVRYDAKDHDELIAMCYEQISDDRHEVRMLTDFKSKYSPDRALWWYLQECFLYKILNYSLESQDIRNLYTFRKILNDIQQQMQEHKCTTPLHVYRCQLMPMELLDKWISSTGQCVVVNSFLSATTNPEVALSFLNSSQVSKEDYCRVLIEIDADPRIVGAKPFVHVGSLHYSTDKDEVLFMFGSVFLLNNITYEEDGFYSIELTLYSDADHEFKIIFDDMKQKYGVDESNPATFAQALCDLDRFVEAEEFVNRHLEQLSPEHEDRFQCYKLLGSIALTKADFDLSLKFYNQALGFLMKNGSATNDLKLADIHENIGDVHWKQGSYDLALQHYSTSLEIKTSKLPSQHSSMAATLENIGRIYEDKREFPQALSHFQRANTMYRRGLPATHDKVAQIDEHIRRISNHMK